MGLRQKANRCGTEQKTQKTEAERTENERPEAILGKYLAERKRECIWAGILKWPREKPAGYRMLCTRRIGKYPLAESLRK